MEFTCRHAWFNKKTIQKVIAKLLLIIFNIFFLVAFFLESIFNISISTASLKSAAYLIILFNNPSETIKSIKNIPTAIPNINRPY